MESRAILVGDNLRYPGGPFYIEDRFMNGVVVGQAGHCYLACFNSALRDSVALRLIVGALNDGTGQGWVWPITSFSEQTLEDWVEALRRPRLLDWRERLSSHLSGESMVKLAIEGYSLDDLTSLRNQAWFVGRSLHAPLWRVYALVPARLWESYGAEFPAFDGQVRQVRRFGAIYDPYVHELTWKLSRGA